MSKIAFLLCCLLCAVSFAQVGETQQTVDLQNPSEAELLQVASGLATQDDNVSLDGADDAMSALDDEDDDEEENLSPEESAAAAQAALEEDDDDDSEDEEKDAEDETELAVERRRGGRKIRRAGRGRCSKRFWAKKWRRCGRRNACRRRWSRRAFSRTCRRGRRRSFRRSRRTVRRFRARRGRRSVCARSCSRSCRLACPFGPFGFACRGHCAASCRKIRCTRYIRLPNPNYYKYTNSPFHFHPLGAPAYTANLGAPFAAPFAHPAFGGAFPFTHPAFGGAFPFTHPAAAAFPFGHPAAAFPFAPQF